VERFHKTIRSEFLRDRVFASLAEAQEELDRWVERYNNRRPHQGIGMVPPLARFALAVPEVAEEPSPPAESPRPAVPPGQLVTRVGRAGRISLASFPYHVGAWLAGPRLAVRFNDLSAGKRLRLCARGRFVLFGATYRAASRTG
jgi:hypothetical protein